MTNRINQVMELADGRKYAVIKQAVYKGNNYYVSLRLTDDEENIVDELIVFQEVDHKGQKSVEQITDQNLLKLILGYVGLLEDNEKSVD